jgi:hypothetical protein
VPIHIAILLGKDIMSLQHAFIGLVVRYSGVQYLEHASFILESPSSIPASPFSSCHLWHLASQLSFNNQKNESFTPTFHISSQVLTFGRHLLAE